MERRMYYPVNEGISVWDRLYKVLISPIVIALISLLENSGYLILIIVGIAFASAFIGIRTDRKLHGKHFDPSKFKEFWFGLCLIVMLMLLVGLSSIVLKVKPEIVDVTIRLMGGIAIYQSISSMIKNGRRLHPRSTALRFFEWFFNFEIFALLKLEIFTKFKKQKCKLDPDKECDDCGQCIEQENKLKFK